MKLAVVALFSQRLVADLAIKSPFYYQSCLALQPTWMYVLRSWISRYGYEALLLLTFPFRFHLDICRLMGTNEKESNITESENRSEYPHPTFGADISSELYSHVPSGHTII